ncbi:hypothetical protein OO17_27430, partial [Rhodopseudomonas palustris]
GGKRCSVGNDFDDRLRLHQDVVVPKAKNLEASTGEIPIPHSVVVAFCMLTAIGLHDQTPFKTNKIDDPWTDRHLSPKFQLRQPSRSEQTP